jgi:hypothetical protein
LNSHGGDREPRVETLTRSQSMLYTVVVLTPNTTFANTYSKLDDAVAYAHRVMSVTGVALDVVILSTVNGVAKVEHRYHNDKS